MENLSKYHLNGLRAVDALARHGTLAAAANELCISPGAISKHVLGVEQKSVRSSSVERLQDLRQ